MTDKKEYKTILKTLVGSRAHGLANPDSDDGLSLINLPSLIRNPSMLKISNVNT